MSGGGVINPDNILIPNADPDAIEAVGRALKDDAADIAQAGHDITAAWAGLEGHYVAPESEELLAAVDPVAADGDEMDDKITTVGQALIDFAEEIRPLLARWKSLKADAETMAADIAEQGEEWTRDEDRVDEHNQLNNDLAAVQTEYQAAERDCANAITALVEGGTRFVAAELDGSTVPARGEVVYGLAEAPPRHGHQLGQPSGARRALVGRCGRGRRRLRAGRYPGHRGHVRPLPRRTRLGRGLLGRVEKQPRRVLGPDPGHSGLSAGPVQRREPGGLGGRVGHQFGHHLGRGRPTPWCPGANGTPGPAM